MVDHTRTTARRYPTKLFKSILLVGRFCISIAALIVEARIIGVANWKVSDTSVRYSVATNEN
jgi:hypothetical protein